MFKKVALLGGRGTIGNVIAPKLRNCEILIIDKPENDLTNYSTFRQIKDVDIIIHLAWVPSIIGDEVHQDNFKILDNILKAVEEYKIPRLVLASSVHAGNFYDYTGPELLQPASDVKPSSKYGKFKIDMELAGMTCAKKCNTEVICIRFGGVNTANTSRQNETMYEVIFLSHKDVVSLVQKIVDTPIRGGHFETFYAVSNNPHRIHSTQNSFNWKPV